MRSCGGSFSSSVFAVGDTGSHRRRTGSLLMMCSHDDALLFSCVHSVFSSWWPVMISALSRPGFHACSCLLSPRLGSSLHSGCLTQFSCLSPVQIFYDVRSGSALEGLIPIWSPAENTDTTCESEIFQPSALLSFSTRWQNWERITTVWFMPHYYSLVEVMSP